MKIYKYLLFILLLIMTVISDSLFSYAASPNLIRVGLVKNIENLTSIRILNTNINLGFTKDKEYRAVFPLKSKNGIEISMVLDSYIPTDIYYNTYQEAKRSLNSKKIDTGIITIAKITSKNEVRFKILKKDSSKNRLSYKSRYLLKIKFNDEVILLDIESIGKNLQLQNIIKNNGINIENKGIYRGILEISTYGKDSLSIVNIIDIEDYLRGVIPLEMSSSWPIESLKAQAVAARSFAMAVSGSYKERGLDYSYKLTDTIAHQSYGGIKVERAETDRAVYETRGEFITYKNKIVKTPYFSTSGGSTEDAMNVWKKDMPWLRAVSDKYEDEPEKKPWNLVLSAEEIARNFSYELSNKRILNINIKKKSKSGRAILIEFITNRGNLSIEGTKFRKNLGLYSTKFNLKKLSVNSYEINGSGYGHGVGLSQSGAKGMALRGYNYKEILKYYYSDVEIN